MIIARADELVGGEHLGSTDAIRHGGPTYAPAELGHRTATVCHVGNIAMLLGRKLDWNPKAEYFGEDDEAANATLARLQRDPWSNRHVDSWINVG